MFWYLLATVIQSFMFCVFTWLRTLYQSTLRKSHNCGYNSTYWSIVIKSTLVHHSKNDHKSCYEKTDSLYSSLYSWHVFLESVWLQARGVNLSCVRSCVVIAEERPRLALTHSFSKLFKDIGLSTRAVSTAFGSRVNLAICLQVAYLKLGSLSIV